MPLFLIKAKVSPFLYEKILHHTIIESEMKIHLDFFNSKISKFEPYLLFN